MKDIELKLWVRCMDDETSTDALARGVKVALDAAWERNISLPLNFENVSAIHVINPETKLVLS